MVSGPFPGFDPVSEPDSGSGVNPDSGPHFNPVSGLLMLEVPHPGYKFCIGLSEYRVEFCMFHIPVPSARAMT